tara:strand:- start:79 stop:396 length:318 start_codon:yes stop_codon:yes gene_type:complete
MEFFKALASVLKELLMAVLIIIKGISVVFYKLIKDLIYNFLKLLYELIIEPIKEFLSYIFLGDWLKKHKENLTSFDALFDLITHIIGIVFIIWAIRWTYFFFSFF